MKEIMDQQNPSETQDLITKAPIDSLRRKEREDIKKLSRLVKEPVRKIGPGRPAKTRFNVFNRI
jgi:hypothetical protein